MLTHKFVGSSNLDSITYDRDSKDLGVVFVSGRHYTYSGVPEEVVRQLIISASAGKFFNQYISKVYPYTN